LEKNLGRQAMNKVEGAFSVEAEEKRQEARGKVWADVVRGTAIAGRPRQ
jgi:hypothetical protein